VQIGLTFSVTSGTTQLAVNPGDIKFTATLAPLAPTIPANTPPPAVAGAPDLPYDTFKYQPAGSYFAPNTKGAYRFTAKTVAGAIPLTITALQTNLLSIFNEVFKDVNGNVMFDTGFAISNTSGTTTSSTGAPAGLPGTITVSLYPMDGVSGVKSFTTSADAKPGVWPKTSSNGTLGPGQTWVVLLTQLLETAKYTGNFYGFIRFQCNFQGGVGINYISDGDFGADPDKNSSAQGYVMMSDVPVVTTNVSGGPVGYF